MPSDLGSFHSGHLATQCFGDQLCAKADTDDGYASKMSLFQQVHLKLDPRMLSCLVDVHGATEAHHSVDIVQILRNRLAGKELNNPKTMPCALQNLTESGRWFVRNVLEDEQCHETSPKACAVMWGRVKSRRYRTYDIADDLDA